MYLEGHSCSSSVRQCTCCPVCWPEVLGKSLPESLMDYSRAVRGKYEFVLYFYWDSMIVLNYQILLKQNSKCLVSTVQFIGVGNPHMEIVQSIRAMALTCKNTAKRNMSSAVCASSMYSRLCMKMLSFLFVCAWAMPRKLHLSCGGPFLVWMPGVISC